MGKILLWISFLLLSIVYDAHVYVKGGLVFILFLVILVESIPVRK